MSVEPGASATPPNPASGTEKTTTTDPKPKDPEHVSYDKYRELLDETKKERNEKRALAERIAEFENRDKTKEEELARKRGDFEKLIATRDAEINELKTKTEAFEKRQKDIQKLGAFIKSANAEIDEKWFGMVDLNSIATDPTTGEIDQMSVAQTVDAFKKHWPEAFKKPGAKMPYEAPGGNAGGFITASEFKKLPLKEMRKYKMNQVIKD